MLFFYWKKQNEALCHFSFKGSKGQLISKCPFGRGVLAHPAGLRGVANSNQSMAGSL